jgi:hypothetical protein
MNLERSITVPEVARNGHCETFGDVVARRGCDELSCRGR